MKYTVLLSLSILFVACSKPDKKQELATLKSQKQEIEAQIKTLEKELGTSDKKEETKIKNVAVSPLTATTFKHFVEVQGAVDATNNVGVSPQMGGAITGVFIKDGDAVSKGQVIATLDNSVLKESIEEVKHQLDLANTLYLKQKNLWDQQIGTEVQYLQAKSGKESLEKRIATLQAQLGMSKVIAPISGTVEIVRQKVGEMAVPGLALAQIINLSGLRVKAKVADTYLGTVRKGDAIVIKFPDLNQEVSARISVVSKTVNPITRTFDIEAGIPNVGGMLKPNQIAIININDQNKAGALVVNQNLIQKTENGDVVYVVEEVGGKKTVKSKLVKVGLSYNGDVEILSGLSVGDKIITEGYQELVDGQQVNY